MRSAIADNALDRQFHADAPNQKSVADALMMAVWRRRKPVQLLHHSDQSAIYTSEHFQELLREQGITCRPWRCDRFRPRHSATQVSAEDVQLRMLQAEAQVQVRHKRIP